MTKKGIKGSKVEYVMLFIDIYAKANNKYMKDYDKTKESLYLKYANVNNFYGRAVS